MPSAVRSSAYGPALRRPVSEGGSATSQAASAVATRIPAGIHAGRSVLRISGSSHPDFTALQSIGPEADVAEPAALRALAHVLGELFLIERRRRPVLALDARDHERLAVAHPHGSEFLLVRQREELDADAAVRALGYLLGRENKQPRIRRERGNEFFVLHERRHLRRRPLVDLHEVLALARLGDEVAE